jgi:RimJ/RimL family protein N-acetyltransferase/GNAT superfamily N-acetyltransferase
LFDEMKYVAKIQIVTTGDDAARVDEILWAVLWQPLGLPRDVRGSFKLDGEEFELLALEDEQVVGGLVAVWTGDGEVELRHVAVASFAQGRGIGRGLVAELCRIAKATHCRRIHTIARNTSAEFLRTLEFQTAPGQAPDHPVFLEHGITFELMEKFVEQGAPADAGRIELFGVGDWPELRTERLLLRGWTPEDGVALAAINSDPRVMEFIGNPLTREQSDAFADSVEARFVRQGFGFWAVEIPGIAPFAGFVGLNVPDFDAPFMPAVEVGWRLGVAFWDRGYASEAARAALDFGFGVACLDEIVAFTTVRNVRSRRVMERIGMTHDACDDFDHRLLPADSPLRRHVLYRASPATLGI